MPCASQPPGRARVREGIADQRSDQNSVHAAQVAAQHVREQLIPDERRRRWSRPHDRHGPPEPHRDRLERPADHGQAKERRLGEERDRPRRVAECGSSAAPTAAGGSRWPTDQPTAVRSDSEGSGRSEIAAVSVVLPWSM